MSSHSTMDLCHDDIKISEKESKRDRCVKITTIVLFFLTVIFLILFLVFFFRSQQCDDRGKQREETVETCNTFNCLQSAAAISLSVDPDAKPCDNFYDFACGRFNANNPLSTAQPVRGAFISINKEVQAALEELLEAQDPNAIDAVQKARTFYKSCTNTHALDARNISRLMNLLKTGGADVFPTLTPNWVDQNWTLNQILARVPLVPQYPVHGNPTYLESPPLIGMQVFADLKQTDRKIIYFSQTALPFGDRDLFLSKDRESERAQYGALYAHLTTALGANPSVAQQDGQDLMQFEILLANATIPQKEVSGQLDKYYNKTTIRELAQWYPQFDWLQFVRDQLSVVDIDVTEDEEVVVLGKEYFDNVFPLINNTPRRTLLNYCQWSIIRAFQDFVGKPLPDSISDVQKVKGTARKTLCTAYTDMFFMDVISRLYTDKYFSQEKRSKVEQMIGDLKEAFRDMVREADWMSQHTKTAALDKVDAMKEKIGYSDMVKNDTYLNEKTSGIVVGETELFNNVLNITGYLHRTNLRTLRDPIDNMAWPVSSANVNAFYNRQTNSIVFPAAFLQKPVYNAEYLDVLMYGGLGFFIGHEITHGFDNAGSDHDKDGNLKMWWQPEDLEQFENRADCLADQYSNYVYPRVNMSIDGRLTLAENIADNGGLKEAYKAYKKLVAKEGKKNPRLPVLPYNPDQLFFIGCAQIWCQNVPDLYIPYLLRDTHSLNRFRVIGPMRNSVDFARAFQCPEGSYMNPKDKCHVW